LAGQVTGKLGHKKRVKDVKFFHSIDPDLQEWVRIAVKAYQANPALTVSKLGQEIGTPDKPTLYKALAAAALDEMYPSGYSDDPERRKHHEENKRALVALVDTGDADAACRAAGWKRWGGNARASVEALLSHYARKRAMELERKAAASLREAKVSDRLTDLVLEELDFEGEMQKAMQHSRMELARGLYVKSKELWDRVMDFARTGVIDRFTAPMIRALTEAASTAVKDAQLLSGQATDRVEGFVKAFNQMSDDELLAFVEQDVTIREIHERELAPRQTQLPPGGWVDEGAEEEVLDAEFIER
jgi:hypothetical protein